jgi:predicted Zn-dependent peptidase
MSGEILELSSAGITVVVVHCPESPTTSVVATYAQGFGHDPEDAPGVAHLHEHRYLSGLRTIMCEPLVVQAQTHADRTRVSATVLAGAERELVSALADTARALASDPSDDAVLVRECRAIDVELSEWFGNPMLLAGHRLAALAARRPHLARFDECRVGGTARLTAESRQSEPGRRWWP